jgi:formate C-acetyltransferase
LDAAKECVAEECHSVAQLMLTKDKGTSPYLSVFVDDCIERGLDATKGGAVYHNDGAHGVGIAPAADAIAAVKKAVFEEKKYSAEELVAAINANFDGYSELRNYLIGCPKMGNNDDYVDGFADIMMDIFADVFAGYKNRFGGVLRPGTGSAMEYLNSAAKVGATADGRYAKSAFGSSFSPSPIARLEGPLSCIQSFTKYDLTKIINGGPLTMEIHDNTFRNDDGIKKVAALVKAFIDLGGHQLQLNSINRDVLLDAQKHPENHKNLIVRVWGWSGYFNELDVEYQNHIISRTEFSA